MEVYPVDHPGLFHLVAPPFRPAVVFAFVCCCYFHLCLCSIRVSLLLCCPSTLVDGSYRCISLVADVVSIAVWQSLSFLEVAVGVHGVIVVVVFQFLSLSVESSVVVVSVAAILIIVDHVFTASFPPQSRTALPPSSGFLIGLVHAHRLNVIISRRRASSNLN